MLLLEGIEVRQDFLQFGEHFLNIVIKKMVILLPANIKKLVELSEKHPDLPIITLVDTEVVADSSHSWWLSKINGVHIDKYYVGEEFVYLYSTSDYDDIFYDDISAQEADKRFEELPWIEAIVVEVGL